MEKRINILITTQHRGVFVARALESTDFTAKILTDLKDVRMVIKWRNGKGVQGIAEDGPKNCQLSSTTPARVIHDVTAIFDIKEEAAKQIWV